MVISVCFDEVPGFFCWWVMGDCHGGGTHDICMFRVGAWAGIGEGVRDEYVDDEEGGGDLALLVSKRSGVLSSVG